MKHELEEKAAASVGRSMSVGAKILANIGFCLFLLVVVAGLSIWQMTKIGVEIAGIAERDVPLTKALTDITIHQLEQAINFERAVRTGEEMQTHHSAQEEFAVAVEKFKKLTTAIDTEIEEAKELAEYSAHMTASLEERTEFEMVSEKLSAIGLEHADYDKKARQAFELLSTGNVEQVLTLMPQIEAEEEDLDKTLENLLSEVGAFTALAAITAEEHEHQAVILLGIATIIALVSGIFAAYLIVSRSINRPLTELVRGLEALIAGDLSVNVRVYANDEIGAVAGAFSRFKENIARTREMEAEQLRLTETAAQERKLAMAQLADDFDKSVGGVVETMITAVDELQSTAQAMAGIAEETSSQSLVVSAASEEASTNVQTVAASAEEMSASIEEIHRRVLDASTASKQAVVEVSETDEQMKTLTGVADKVGEVVSMIADIAGQTNLLALNATIEAARAGSAGRGFAVVASEVKALASQTATATEDITRQIQEIQVATARTVGSMGNVSQIIGVIDEASATIASAMEEQGAVTQEIARSIQEAATGTQQVAGNISGVTLASQEAGSAADQVMSRATMLAEQAASLQSEANKFIAEVRTG